MYYAQDCRLTRTIVTFSPKKLICEIFCDRRIGQWWRSKRRLRGNEKSELIARRLARLLEAKDLIQPAIEVLQKALEFNPLNQRLHFYLAQLILRSRPDSTTKNAASMLHHLQRSFTAGDQNHEARFWYARQLCLTGSFQEAKPIFASLRALPLPFKQKHEPRDSFWARIALP